MATDEERIKILKMVNEGKINAEQGAQLLSALDKSRTESDRLKPAKTSSSGRTLRVRVTDMITGKPKATVNLPLGLVDAGLNIASHYVPDVAFDKLIDSIKSGVDGKLIDVLDEEDGEHVEIFID
ncbi:MAG: SHOCT-like domain-containing protein [Anaerolineales bacterium]|jgi:hypothetical protein